MKNLITLVVIILTTINLGKAQTQIDQSYFATNYATYSWDMAGSPYIIKEDIFIHYGSNLIIEPGVEVHFDGYFMIDVKGSINAIGNALDQITITSDIGNPWNGIRFDFSDGTLLSPSKFYYCKFSNAEKIGANCQVPDAESSGGAIYVRDFSDIEIIDCEFFNNIVQAHGGAIALFEGSILLLETTQYMITMQRNEVED
jgi:hypothetical protein